jgi:hypothetical protein
LLVNRCLFVEVKAVETVIPIHKAQLLSYTALSEHRMLLSCQL